MRKYKLYFQSEKRVRGAATCVNQDCDCFSLPLEDHRGRKITVNLFTVKLMFSL